MVKESARCVAIVVMVCLSLLLSQSARAYCNPQGDGYKGPTDGSLHGVEVWYYNYGATIRYEIYNTTERYLQIFYQVGETRTSVKLEAGVCYDTIEQAGTDLRVYRLREVQ